MSEKAPESIFLKACHPASPNHNCTWSVNKGPEDSVEYVRADLLATARREEREAAFKEAVAIVEKLVCPAQFDGNWRNGYCHAQNEAFLVLERAATTDKEKR